MKCVGGHGSRAHLLSSANFFFFLSILFHANGYAVR